MTSSSRYQTLKKIGAGGDGVVYLAKDRLGADQKVALKVFKRAEDGKRAQKQFQLLSQLFHPHLLEIYDYGKYSDGKPYLASEYFEGQSLDTWSKNKNLNTRLELLSRLSLALDDLHAQKIVHLDLKPSNILVSSAQNHFKILDFGMASFTRNKRHQLPAGTLSFMSPEALEGQKTDQRSDLYAWGIIAYLVLYQKLPFANNQPDIIINTHLYQEITIPQKYNIPAGIGKIIKTCLEKKPLKRFKRGLDIAKELNSYLKKPFDLSTKEFLTGTHRQDLLTKLENFFSEMEFHFEKKQGQPPKDLWNERLAQLLRYQSGLNKIKKLTSQEKQLQDKIANIKARLLLEKSDYHAITQLKANSVDLQNTKGLAYFYLGQYTKADLLFKKALSQATDLREKADSLNYLGMSAYNQAHYPEAFDYYQKAHAYMLKLGQPRPLASVLMNFGALYQQKNQYEEAINAYQQALKLAKKINHFYLVGLLLNNLANLYLLFGSLNQAKAFLVESKKLTRTGEFRFLIGYNQLIEGDIQLLQKKHAVAETFYLEAQKLFEDLEMKREVAIAQNNLFENALFENKLKKAGTYAQTPTQKNIIALYQGKKARLSPSPSPLELIALCCFYQKTKNSEKLTQTLSKAYQHYQTFYESIPFDYRKLAIRHPQWQTLYHLYQKYNQEDPVKLAHFKKLLEVNQKMTEEHRLDKLLQFVMDVVIDICGAERGFLILASSLKNKPFKINVARNLDQETVQKPAYKISRTLVSKVLDKKKALLTTDAGNDPRLKSSKSIQGLKLKSILCVPLIHRKKTIGAIYVENRFQKGVFTEDHVEILSAFADQAAIAMENARLYEENDKKADKISKLNDQLESLVAKQSLQLDQVTHQLEKTQRRLENKHNYDNIIGNSPQMQKVFDVLDKITDREISVLVMGESGTGKELIAKALHYNSPRKNKEFVAINCSAIPGHLLESELFGYKRGAFTGADREHVGLFETAQGGTLFLDEIGDMPLEMQAKLLRALQEKEIRRIGSHRKISIDVRVVSATNKDLEKESGKGNFRQDLYYRLNAINIKLPPLRKRREDIALLAQFFLKKFDRDIKISPAALNILATYDWPGNIRELANEIERAVALAEGEITPNLFSEALLGNTELTPSSTSDDIRHSRNQYEKSLIQNILAQTKGNKSQAAKKLGISRMTLYQKMEKLEIRV